MAKTKEAKGKKRGTSDKSKLFPEYIGQLGSAAGGERTGWRPSWAPRAHFPLHSILQFRA